MIAYVLRLLRVMVLSLVLSPATHATVPVHNAHAVASPTTTSALTSNAPMVDGTADAATGGYWLTAADGAVFNFDAPFVGSAAGLALSSAVVGMAATADDGGYWLVAADGGVFTFDAPFEGSAGALRLTAPVVGMAPTADDRGYWLVAADGGVFSYGDAGFAGSMGAVHLTRAVVGMARSPSGGYWLVAADGGIFSFAAPYEGSTGALVLDRAVVAMTPTADGRGYWLVGADGGVYALGDAVYRGSVAVAPLAGLTVVIDPGHNGGNGSASPTIDRPINGGGLTEPCDTTGTETDNGYTEHAFNFDVALRAQALLQADGARVVLTRASDTGVGPCVNVRAAIANALDADVAVSIHADGGPPGGSGFAVDTPVPVVSAISDNRAIVAPSDALSVDLRNAFQAATGEPPSNYTGTNGIVYRSDLGGLDLSTVPKVLIECANMRNAHDAADVQSAPWRQSAAQGIASGVELFLEVAQRA